MHREIMNPPPDHEVIFLNGDKLDCRRENLRVVTKEEARQHHRRARSDSESGIKGLTYNRRPRTWSVNVYRNGHAKRVGTFWTKQDALDAYHQVLRRENPELHSAPEVIERIRPMPENQAEANGQELTSPESRPQAIRPNP
jgi:hypothetical protein